MKFIEKALLFLLISGIAAIGNTIAHKVPFLTSLLAMLVLVLITLVGLAISSVIPGKIPVVFWISLVALVTTSPVNPYGKVLADFLSKLDFMSIATPILAYAGLSAGKDMVHFKNISWRLVIVALLVYTGTFIGATFISQIVLKLQGTI